MSIRITKLRKWIIWKNNSLEEVIKSISGKTISTNTIFAEVEWKNKKIYKLRFSDKSLGHWMYCCTYLSWGSQGDSMNTNTKERLYELTVEYLKKVGFKDIETWILDNLKNSLFQGVEFWDVWESFWEENISTVWWKK